MIPPPGRPMLPSSSWTIEPARIICTPGGVLRPAHGVGEHRRALAARVGDQRVGDLEEQRRAGCRRCARPSPACSGRSGAGGSGRRSAGAGASGRVRQPSASMPDAVRSRERPAWSAPRGRPPCRVLARPRTSTRRGRRCPSRGSKPEKSPSRSSVSWKSSLHDQRRVRVVDDVVLEVGLRLDDVADQAAEERDVRAGADRHVEVRDRARARVVRVDVDDLRAALTRLHDPARADRDAPRPATTPGSRRSRRSGSPAGSWWRRRARARSPDRGPWRSVICGPGSRSAPRPAPCRAS